jgi:hypothetical protein
MKRLAFYLLLLALAVTAGFFLLRPTPKPPIIPAAPGVNVRELKGTIQSLGVKVGDPVVVQIPQTDSRWKTLVIVPSSRDMMIDIGLGYELIRVDPPILPPLTLDAMATPARYGIGLSTPLTEHVDLEAGISRRWDASEIERYIGVGFQIAW